MWVWFLGGGYSVTRTISTSSSYDWCIAVARAPAFVIAAVFPFLIARVAALHGGSAIFGSRSTERMGSGWMIGAHAPTRTGAINLLAVFRGIKHALAARQLAQLEHTLIGESDHAPGAPAGSRQVAEAIVDALMPVLGTAIEKIASRAGS